MTQVRKNPHGAPKKTKNGRILRCGKHCVAFVGAPDSKQRLPLWLAVGGPIMTMHYRFLHRYTWYSHSEEQSPVMEFCHGSPDHRNPAVPTLSALANMLFDPSGAGKALLGPLHAKYGAPIFWTSAVLAEFQTSVVLAFSRLWRCLVHGFKLMPWLLGPLFDIRQPLGRRQAQAIEYWETPPCCIDVYLGR